MTNVLTLRRTRRKRLAICVATAFALTASAVHADTFVVNCNDAGIGSLRAAVANVHEGDIVNMSRLTTASEGCSASTITLKNGDIVATANSLTIQGPTSGAFTVTGKYVSPTGVPERNRILTHTGTGTLAISNLALSKGYVLEPVAPAVGGCIYSAGSVELDGVTVAACQAVSSTAKAYGGGIYAKANLALNNSTVTRNRAYSYTANAHGGGAFVGGALNTNNMALVDNVAVTHQISQTGYGLGGGVFVSSTSDSPSLVANSTISGNAAGSTAGGMVFQTTAPVTIVQSTISGNVARDGTIGGAYIHAPESKIYNSTIAFNVAALPNSAYSAGLMVGIGTLRLESTLVAHNSYYDDQAANDLTSRATISGHNNLIGTSAANLPPDTIVGACPLLGPLRNNGGTTLTHALLSRSPAIDTGNNAFGSEFDQRGSPHARQSGPPGSRAPIADIGAYEVDQSDEIFSVDFEGCS